MKLLLALVAVVVPLTLASLPSRILYAPEKDIWKQWKKINSKEYDSDIEELKRFDIWRDNLKKVKNFVLAKSMKLYFKVKNIVFDCLR